MPDDKRDERQNDDVTSLSIQELLGHRNCSHSNEQTMTNCVLRSKAKGANAFPKTNTFCGFE